MLRQRYLAAAGTYNSAERPISLNENSFCSTGPPADLGRCQAALSADRQATITFDNALRAITFPASARADAGRLLADDGQLELVLMQASTAPSLSAISALTPRIFQLLTVTTSDAAKVRGDIGVPLPSASPSAA